MGAKILNPKVLFSILACICTKNNYLIVMHYVRKKNTTGWLKHCRMLCLEICDDIGLFS